MTKAYWTKVFKEAGEALVAEGRTTASVNILAIKGKAMLDTTRQVELAMAEDILRELYGEPVDGRYRLVPKP